jgi:hypothetical protein
MTTQEKIEAIESARRDACRAHNDRITQGLPIARHSVREFLDDCDSQITALYQRLVEEL